MPVRVRPRAPEDQIRNQVAGFLRDEGFTFTDEQLAAKLAPVFAELEARYRVINIPRRRDLRIGRGAR